MLMNKTFSVVLHHCALMLHTTVIQYKSVQADQTAVSARFIVWWTILQQPEYM